jgi:hypothetical protein
VSKKSSNIIAMSGEQFFDNDEMNSVFSEISNYMGPSKYVGMLKCSDFVEAVEKTDSFKNFNNLCEKMISNENENKLIIKCAVMYIFCVFNVQLNEQKKDEQNKDEQKNEFILSMRDYFKVQEFKVSPDSSKDNALEEAINFSNTVFDLFRKFGWKVGYGFKQRFHLGPNQDAINNWMRFEKPL